MSILPGSQGDVDTQSQLARQQVQLAAQNALSAQPGMTVLGGPGTTVSGPQFTQASVDNVKTSEANDLAETDRIQAENTQIVADNAKNAGSQTTVTTLTTPENSVELNDGTYVSQDSFNKLTPEEQSQLIEMGTDAFNAQQNAQYQDFINKNIQVTIQGKQTWIPINDWNKLTDDQKKEVQATGKYTVSTPSTTTTTITDPKQTAALSILTSAGFATQNSDGSYQISLTSKSGGIVDIGTIQRAFPDLTSDQLKQLTDEHATIIADQATALNQQVLTSEVAPYETTIEPGSYIATHGGTPGTSIDVKAALAGGVPVATLLKAGVSQIAITSLQNPAGISMGAATTSFDQDNWDTLLAVGVVPKGATMTGYDNKTQQLTYENTKGKSFTVDVSPQALQSNIQAQVDKALSGKKGTDSSGLQTAIENAGFWNNNLFGRTTIGGTLYSTDSKGNLLTDTDQTKLVWTSLTDDQKNQVMQSYAVDPWKGSNIGETYSRMLQAGAPLGLLGSVLYAPVTMAIKPFAEVTTGQKASIADWALAGVDVASVGLMGGGGDMLVDTFGKVASIALKGAAVTMAAVNLPGTIKTVMSPKSTVLDKATAVGLEGLMVSPLIDTSALKGTISDAVKFVSEGDVTDFSKGPTGVSVAAETITPLTGSFNRVLTSEITGPPEKPVFTTGSKVTYSPPEWAPKVADYVGNIGRSWFPTLKTTGLGDFSVEDMVAQQGMPDYSTKGQSVITRATTWNNMMGIRDTVVPATQDEISVAINKVLGANAGTWKIGSLEFPVDNPQVNPYVQTSLESAAGKSFITSGQAGEDTEGRGGGSTKEQLKPMPWGGGDGGSSTPDRIWTQRQSENLDAENATQTRWNSRNNVITKVATATPEFVWPVEPTAPSVGEDLEAEMARTKVYNALHPEINALPIVGTLPLLAGVASRTNEWTIPGQANPMVSPLVRVVPGVKTQVASPLTITSPSVVTMPTISTAGATETRMVPLVDVEEVTKQQVATALQTGTKQITQPQVSTSTKAGIVQRTGTMVKQGTGTQTDVKTRTATQTQTITQTKTGIDTSSPPDETIVEGLIIPKGSKKKAPKKLPAGTIVWKGGRYWNIVPPPYDVRYSSKTAPAGAVNTEITGKGMAVKTLQVIGGPATQNANVKLGFMNVHITAGSTSIRFVPNASAGRKSKKSFMPGITVVRSGSIHAGPRKHSRQSVGRRGVARFQGVML